MAPSSPTTPKLRRSATASSAEHDIEKGATGDARTHDDTIRVPLLPYPPSSAVGLLHASSTTGNASSKSKRAQAFLVLLAMLTLVASPWIYWVALYILTPYISDETCPIKQWNYPDCHGLLTHEQGKGIPPLKTQEEWVELRTKFQRSVKTSSLAKDWQRSTKLRKTKEGDLVEEPNTGFHVPVKFKYSPGKGRGVYASETIRKGEQIWDNRFQGVFDNECSAKMYFNQLSNDEQCMALFWGYSNNFYGKGFQYMFDTDGHAYLNHCEASSPDNNAVHHFEGEMDTSKYGLPQIFTLPLGSGGFSEDTLRRRRNPGAHGLYASRDIHPGEEICFDYSEVQINAYFDYFQNIWTHSLKWYQWFNL